MTGAAQLIVWSSLGLRIESINESEEQLIIYISVPETSYRFNANGKMMAGKFLRQRFKQAMIDMGIKRLTVKGRNRMGEHWTKEMGDTAELETKKCLFGSQY